MNNLTLLETILIIWIIVTNILAVLSLITTNYASSKTSDTILMIAIGVAMPIVLPVILYSLTFDKLKHRKRKQDLEKQIKELENDK
ncbi:MAG: hypothetical protein WC188_12695 [Candidatus Caldatribacteriota bacterium]